MIEGENAALIVVDIQGKLSEIVYESEKMLKQAEIFIQGAKLLGLPILWVEQYPQGLGPTNEVIARHLTEESLIEKTAFSACLNMEFIKEVEKLRNSILFVIGIEAHICVYQTVRELLELDWFIDVEVVVDAVSSRTLQNKEIGLEKMKSFGAQFTSVETALFELMKTAEHPKFKEISALIK